MRISEKGSGRDGSRPALQKRCGTIGVASTERQENENRGSGDTRRWRLQQQRCGMAEMAVCRGGQQRPASAKKNTCDCGRDDGMIRTVGRRDTRTIETVEAGGDAADIQDSVGWIRETEMLGGQICDGGGWAGWEGG